MQKANCNFTRFSLCLSISLTKSYNNIILLTIYKKPEVTIIFMTSDSLYLFYTVLTPKSASLSGLSFPCFSWIILLLISKRSWIDSFFSWHCLFLCYCLSFSFSFILNCCICFNAGSWHTQTRARAAWSLKFARGGSPFGRPPHTAQNAAGRQAKQRKNE